MTSDVQTHTTHAKGREKLFAHLAMILFAILIAASFSLGKLAVPHIEPAPLNAFRFMLGTLLMGIFTYGVRRNRFAMPEAPWRFGILGGLMAIYFLAMFVALTMTAPVATSAVFTLMPIMTAFFAYLILKQIIRPLVGVSLLVAGFGSIWVIFRGDFNAILSFDIGNGELIFLGGCVCHAIFAALIRKFSHGEPLSLTTFYILVATTIWITLYGAGSILTTNWMALPPIVWWTLAYLAIFPTAITFFLMQYASMRLPSSKVLAYGYLVPAFVIIYEGLAGHGWVSMSVVVGALVTILGLVVLALAPDS